MATEVNIKNNYKSKYPRRFRARERRLVEANGIVVTNAESYTIKSGDNVRVVRNTGTSTIHLPPAAENTGRLISFFQTNAAVLTLDPNGSEQINGGATYTEMDAANDNVTIISNGTAWLLVSRTIS